MTIVWESADPKTVLVRLTDRYTAQLVALAILVFQRRAPEIETWMKVNAPWTDRTGNARQRLFTRVVASPEEVMLVMAHGVEYGIYLETGNLGAYAIVGPAVRAFAPIVMADLRRRGVVGDSA